MTNNHKITISEETQIDTPPPRSLMTLEKRDWARVKRMVESIKTSHNRWENAAWFSASVILTCFATALTFQNALKEIFFGISLASFIITIILFIASKTFSDAISLSKDQVISEMDEIEKNAKINQELISNNITELKIIKAIYGTSTNQVDVFTQVIGMLNDNKLQLTVSNALSEKGDPHPGIVKELQLSYSYQGKSFDKTYKEGENVSLP